MTSVHEERQEQKRWWERYRMAARRLSGGGRVDHLAHVVEMADGDGAFVEVTLWIPKEEAAKETMFTFDKPWLVQKLSLEEFLIGMTSLGTPQEIQMVGSFEDASNTSVRTAHRDIDLPLHRDGIYTKALADMQGGMYVEKPNVDVVGMYCLRDNGDECYTTISGDGVNVIAEVNLRTGEALIMDNRLFHGRRGPVGKRLLIRFWTTLKKAEINK